MDLKERFLKYVSYDTQSSEESTTFPSTEKQKVLLAALRDEMEALGMTEVTMDQYGYVMGTVPASKGCENAPVIGFIAHVDTSPDMSGKEVKPRVIDEYDGSDIALNGQLTMRVADFPELAFFKGHTLIHTDGTTLLGADDKAGVAEIMTAAEYLMAHPEVKHGKIRIGFTPDEEVGRGVDFFDVKAFGADFAYTVDGGMEGELEYENFNAASAKVEIQGRNVHPGYAKNKMINAIDVACELQGLLPASQRPQFTEGYEGFYHCVGLNGTVENASVSYIIRDHDAEKFEQKKVFMWAAVDLLKKKYGEFSVKAAAQATKTELSAVAAERSCEDFYAAEYMKKHIGEEFDGIISGVIGSGLFVELPNTVEGKIDVRSLSENYFEVRNGIALYDGVAGTMYTIGDKVRVKCINANVNLGQIDFELIKVYEDASNGDKAE